MRTIKFQNQFGFSNGELRIEGEDDPSSNYLEIKFLATEGSAFVSIPVKKSAIRTAMEITEENLDACLLNCVKSKLSTISDIINHHLTFSPKGV